MVNMVPEGTNSGSSPKCAKMLDTIIVQPLLQYPNSLACRLTPHLRLQKWHCCRILFAILSFKSKKDFAGVGSLLRFLLVHIFRSILSNSIMLLSCCFQSASNGSFSSNSAGSFFAIINLAGFWSCMTAKYLAKLFLTNSSSRIFVASGRVIFHILPHSYSVGWRTKTVRMGRTRRSGARYLLWESGGSTRGSACLLSSSNG